MTRMGCPARLSISGVSASDAASIQWRSSTTTTSGRRALAEARLADDADELAAPRPRGVQPASDEVQLLTPAGEAGHARRGARAALAAGDPEPARARAPAHQLEAALQQRCRFRRDEQG